MGQHGGVIWEIGQPHLDERDQFTLIGRATVGLREAGIVFEFRLAERRAHVLPLGLKGKNDQVAARSLEHAEGTDERMMIAHPVRHEGPVAQRMRLERNVLHVEHGIHHAEIQPLALPSTTTVKKREAYRREGVHAATDVTHREAHRHRWTLGIACHVHEAGEGLCCPVVAGLV